MLRSVYETPISSLTPDDILVEYVQEKVSTTVATAAFAELYRRYYRPILGRINYLVRDLEESKNLCQDIFLIVLTKLQKKDKDAPFDRWLHRIAANKAYDYLRRKRKVEMVRLPEEDSDMEDYEPVDLSVLISKDRGVEDQVCDIDSAERLLNLVNPNARDCLILHVQWGLQQTEIADILDISPKRVNEYIHRASRNLRQLYPYLQVAKATKKDESQRKGGLGS